MWAALAPIGRDPRTGGYRRTSFEPGERACVAWFAAEARRRDLRVDADGNGNLVAWWWPPGARERPIISGSHLDSVPDGGAFDGPLGVVSALAALDVLRARHFRPRRPIGIAVFAEEEGARIGVACLGSRLLTGMLPVDAASGLRDAAGAGIEAAMRACGLTPSLGRCDLPRDPAAYVEVHIEQGRALTAPVGIASAIWPHGRWRFAFSGRSDHAGTTRLVDRQDPVHPTGVSQAPAEAATPADCRAGIEALETVLAGLAG